MAVYNGELYVAGQFLKSDGNIGNNIQKWNGTLWSDVGGGTDEQIENLQLYNGKLYAMGIFSTAGGIPAQFIAIWDGTQWCSLGSKFNNVIGTSCIYKDSLYIGGGFTQIDGEPINYIAEWTGGNYTDSCGNDATSVSEVKGKSAVLEVYPNPGNGNFTLALSNVNAAYTVQVYNVLGERVYIKTLPQSHSDNTINLTGQPSGVYFYRVIQESGGLVGEGKIIVQQ